MYFPKLLVLAAVVLNLCAAAPEKETVFIGTYTEGNSKGIYAYELNLKDGGLRQIGLAAESSSPSFLAIHPNKQWLYAVNEVANLKGKKTGAITGFKIDPQNWKLTRINDSSTGGDGPCHISID